MATYRNDHINLEADQLDCVLALAFFLALRPSILDMDSRTFDQTEFAQAPLKSCDPTAPPRRRTGAHEPDYWQFVWSLRQQR
jgi:hypothetical protein